MSNSTKNSGPVATVATGPGRHTKTSTKRSKPLGITFSTIVRAAMEDFEPKGDQARALSLIKEWSTRQFYLGGYAGTGKTTLSRAMMGPGVIFAAFTNKAVKVLRSKGIAPVYTLHSLLYTPIEFVETEEDASGEIVRETRRLAFEPNPREELLTAKLLVVDEASMVSASILRDIRDVVPDLPVLAVGDPMQLPPVEGAPAFGRPDFVMTTIQRQALDNPIIRLSMEVREGKPIREGTYDGRVAKIVTRAPIEKHLDALLRADQVLCGTHKIRRKAIRAMRRTFDRTTPLPLTGDRLMILSNEREQGVFNGDEVRALEDAQVPNGNEMFGLSVQNEEGAEISLTMSTNAFEVPHPKDYTLTRGAALADFAEAITVHKAQGSEWRNVVLIDDWSWPGAPHRDRWLYTAITRAAERLIIFGRQ